MLDKGSMRPARIINCTKISETLYHVEIELLKELPFKPRSPQFVMIWIPGLESIPMSIAGCKENLIELVVKPVGRTTLSLVNAKQGETIGVKGPLGKALKLDGSGKYLLVAGGSGLAPIKMLHEELESKKIEHTIVFGGRSASEIGDISGLLRGTCSRIYISSDDGSIGFKGSAVELALRLLEAETYTKVVACGPKPMLKYLAKGIARFRDVETWVILENMVKCGLGVCGSCEIDGSGLLVCRDGPGFLLEEVVEWLEVK